MRFPKLKRWWINFLTSAKEKCTLGNLIDLSVMSVFALANAIMSAAHPVVTTITTSAAIGLSYAADAISNRTKINKLRKLKDLLDDEAEEIGNLEQKYPGMSKGKWLFLVVSTSCLGCYVIISFVGGAASVFGIVAVVGASTIFHISKKFYNSPLARDIYIAEIRLSEVVRKRLPLVVEQEMQEQAIATLMVEKERSRKQIQELQQRLSELREQYRKMEDEKAGLQEQLKRLVEITHELQESIYGLGKQNTELVIQVAVLKTEGIQLRESSVMVQQQLVVKTKEVESLGGVIANKNEELSKLSEQCRSLQEELRIEREKTEVLERDIQILRFEYKGVSNGPRV